MLLDNKTQGNVAEALKAALDRDARVALLTNDLSIFAFDALREHLGPATEARILLGSSLPQLGSKTSKPGLPVPSSTSLLGAESERSFRNTLRAPYVARKCAAWLRDHADVRAVTAPIPHCLYHVQATDGTATAIQGSSALTCEGLGLVPSARYEMNTCVTSSTEAAGLLGFFDHIWANREISVEAKKELLSRLAAIYEPNAPQRIYFATLFNLFHDTLHDLDEEQIVKSRTGIHSTVIWQKLYRFQRDGVLGTIDKLERYNGCIIADSVGLGKTFEALAVIKYYELRNDRVLVLCPKKLRENWTLYTVNDRRNIFASDRFNYDVLNHTDLTRTSGQSGELNLESINWGNYDLVVIDESHNFRNNSPRKDGLSRYGRLMADIIQAGVKTKVLMLSATPVNSRMNDLKNQVAFITEGRDDALYDAGIASIEQTLRIAQGRFNQWLKRDPEERNTESLLEALNFDYFKLLDLLTIARSRKHIAKYYNIEEIGEFPRRARPINLKADIDSAGLFPELREVNRDIRRLNLSAYAPLKYVLPEKVAEYSRRYDIEIEGGRSFRQVDREESLIHLMRVNLLKRMESSICSFTHTLEKLLAMVQLTRAAIDSHDAREVEELSIEDIDLDSDDFDSYLVGTRVKVLVSDVDRVRWKQDLEEDELLLVKLLREARMVDANRDEKLRQLKELIAAKVREPINADNRKLIIFTAFADTADYLYDNISQWALREFGIHSASVTGRSSSNKTTFKGIRTDLASILTSFSPVSKERSKIDPTLDGEIDILIATDCISEGQNLQDCDYLVNYDIHWNPVRIIQRFGRIDRLGSRNATIQLVNFWPNMELDEYINLEARVSGRMVLLDISATGEENVIEATGQDQMNDLEYRRRQFEQLQDEVVDLEDLSSGISITDLTLNDFRMDLGEYLKGNAEYLENLAPGAYAVTQKDDLLDDEVLEPGVFFCLRSDHAQGRRDASYALAPHYVVFVSDDGRVLLNYTHTRRILDLMKKVAIGRNRVDDEARRRFDPSTRNGADANHVRSLLARTVQAITGKVEEEGIQSLFQRGGTAIGQNNLRGLDDFEVVAYLVVLGDELK